MSALAWGSVCVAGLLIGMFEPDWFAWTARLFASDVYALLLVASR